MKKLQTYFYLNSAFIYTKERKESTMIVIATNKTTMDVAQYNNVSNIAYNSGTKIYTITYGSSQTKTFSGDDWLIAVLFS